MEMGVSMAVRPRLDAPDLIAGLFGDNGKSLLANAGMPADWKAILGGMPMRMFMLDDAEQHPGLILLARVRDFWGDNGLLRQATPIAEAVLPRLRAAFGAEHPHTLFGLGKWGAFLDEQGRSDLAREPLEQAHEGLRAVLGGKDLRVAIVAAALGVHYGRSGRLTSAEPLMASAYRIRCDVDPDSAGQVAGYLGEIKANKDELADARRYLLEAWEYHKRRFGIGHPHTRRIARSACGVLSRLKIYGESVEIWRAIYENDRDSGNQSRVADSSFELGIALHGLGKIDEATRMIDGALRWTREAGRPHADLPRRLTVWSTLMIEKGRANEAEGLLLEALEAEKVLFGDSSPEVAKRYVSLGHLCAQQRRNGEAMGWLDPAASLLRSSRGDQHPDTHMAVRYLVEVLVTETGDALNQGDRELASRLWERAVELALPVLGSDHQLSRDLQSLAARKPGQR